MKENERYWEVNKFGYNRQPDRSELLACASCGLLGGRDWFTRGRGDWIDPEPPQCLSCFKMEQEEVKALGRYYKTDAYSEECQRRCDEREAERLKDLEDYDLVEGYCRDCTAPVWTHVKRGETKVGSLSCGCWGRQINDDNF